MQIGPITFGITKDNRYVLISIIVKQNQLADFAGNVRQLLGRRRESMLVTPSKDPAKVYARGAGRISTNA